MCGRGLWFNFYFVIILATLLPACKTSEERQRDKELSTLRFHLETNPDGSQRNSGVPVYRAHPILVNVMRDPYLHEGDLQSATLVDTDPFGGFAIRVEFNRHGALVLENVTTANRGRRTAIYSQFTEARWLAAPVLPRIVNGTVVFTPDATREEAERIVRGLNNVIAKLK